MPRSRREARPFLTVADLREICDRADADRDYSVVRRDGGRSGLAVAARDGEVTFQLRFGDKTRVIASLARMTLEVARERAAAGREMFIAGTDPGPYFRAFLATRSDSKARDEAARAQKHKERRVDEGWTFEELIRNYIDLHIKLGRRSGDRMGRKPPSGATLKDVETTFARPPVDAIRNRRVRSLTKLDVEAVRDALGETFKASVSDKFVTYTKAAFKLARVHHASSGVSDLTPWWLELAPNPVFFSKRTPRTRRRAPTPAELARLLFIAESNRKMPGRQRERETHEIVLCALWWIIFTAQRRTSAVQILRENIGPYQERPGWSVALFRAETMKSRYDHTLPLPPVLTAMIARARRAIPVSEFLLPATRRGKDGGITHLSSSSVTLLIRRLAAKDPYLVDVDVKEDLLGEDLGAFTPHVVRKSLQRTARRLKVPRVGSDILDHSRTPGVDETAAAYVTRKFYYDPEDLFEKEQGMAPWASAILTAYEAILAERFPDDEARKAAHVWRPEDEGQLYDPSQASPGAGAPADQGQLQTEASRLLQMMSELIKQQSVSPGDDASLSKREG